MGSAKTVKFKCPYCDKRYTRQNLVIHVSDVHDDMIPENYSALRVVFNYINKKPIDYSGKCTECGGKTDWDENKGRYNRQCNNPKCKESYIRKFEENMKRTKGYTRISSTPEGQQKMLANRKISGVYKFQNGVEKTYTGSYELKALEFMDKVMNIDPADLSAPGPVMEYMFEGKKHLYITDFYYIPYNLIIEVKDGGKNPNKRVMPEYRAKQIEKEKYIIKNTNYNYIRLTDNDLSQLLSVFMDLKMQLVDNTNERVIHVNEAMNALMSGYMPGWNGKQSVYIVNYLQNNVFSGDWDRGYGITNNPKLTNLICRNKEGVLSKAPDNFIENCKYDVYLCSNITSDEVSKLLEDYIGEFVEEGFIYEKVFGKKMYSYDQIMTEKSAIPVLDFYQGMEYLKEVTRNYIIGKPNTIVKCLDENASMNVRTGNYVIESNLIPELVIESNKDDYKDKSKFLNMLVHMKGE